MSHMTPNGRVQKILQTAVPRLYHLHQPEALARNVTHQARSVSEDRSPSFVRCLPEGKSVSEIAKQIAIPRGTVAAWVRRNSFGIRPIDRLTPTAILDATVARLQGIYLEAMQSGEASKSGTTVETHMAVDENNFVRSRTANRRDRKPETPPPVPAGAEPVAPAADSHASRKPRNRRARQPRPQRRRR